jgi:hypothetical protein
MNRYEKLLQELRKVAQEADQESGTLEKVTVLVYGLTWVLNRTLHELAKEKP